MNGPPTARQTRCVKFSDLRTVRVPFVVTEVDAARRQLRVVLDAPEALSQDVHVFLGNRETAAIAKTAQ